MEAQTLLQLLIAMNLHTHARAGLEGAAISRLPSWMVVGKQKFAIP